MPWALCVNCHGEVPCRFAALPVAIWWRSPSREHSLVGYWHANRFLRQRGLCGQHGIRFLVKCATTLWYDWYLYHLVPVGNVGNGVWSSSPLFCPVPRTSQWREHPSILCDRCLNPSENLAITLSTHEKEARIAFSASKCISVDHQFDCQCPFQSFQSFSILLNSFFESFSSHDTV